MENKYTAATPQRPKGDRLMDAPVVEIDLPLFISLLKEEKTWKESDRNAITVFKTNAMSILLIALHKGTIMPKHSVPGALSIQVAAGVMELKTKNQNTKLSTGQMLALHSKIEHSITAIEETFFLLTINTDCKIKETPEVINETSFTEYELLYREIF